jgi:hypothetical protein
MSGYLQSIKGKMPNMRGTASRLGWGIVKAGRPMMQTAQGAYAATRNYVTQPYRIREEGIQRGQNRLNRRQRRMMAKRAQAQIRGKARGRNMRMGNSNKPVYASKPYFNPTYANGLLSTQEYVSRIPMKSKVAEPMISNRARRHGMANKHRVESLRRELQNALKDAGYTNYMQRAERIIQSRLDTLQGNIRKAQIGGMLRRAGKKTVTRVGQGLTSAGRATWGGIARSGRAAQVPLRRVSEGIVSFGDTALERYKDYGIRSELKRKAKRAEATKSNIARWGQINALRDEIAGRKTARQQVGKAITWTNRWQDLKLGSERRKINKRLYGPESAEMRSLKREARRFEKQEAAQAANLRKKTAKAAAEAAKEARQRQLRQAAAARQAEVRERMKELAFNRQRAPANRPRTFMNRVLRRR